MDGEPGVTLHGNLDPVPEPFVATMPASGSPGMAVRFTSDGSVTRAGFSASMTCVVPDDPMCSNTNLVLDYTANGGAHQGFHATGHALFGADVIHAPSFDQVAVVVAEPLEACDALTNAAAMPGKIALIQRGTCAFVLKVLNAQNAGAVAAIIYNHSPGMVTMGGDNADVTIPAVFLTIEDGTALNEAVTADPSTIASLHCGGDWVHMPDPCSDLGLSQVDSGDITLGGLTNNQVCTWSATCSSPTDVVTVTFSSFEIETNWDFLYVYQSADTSGDVAVTLTGSLPEGSSWTSEGPTASAVYDSDGSVNRAGFVGTFSCGAAAPPPPPSACQTDGGATLGPGDALVMPPPGETMDNNMLCTWTLVCPDGQAPEVTFSAFNIESGWDFLRVDTDGNGSPNVEFSGSSAPDPVTGSASTNTYVYDSDGSVNRPGFTGAVACVAAPPPPPPDACAGSAVALGPGDTFSSDHRNNRNCAWTTSCPSGTPTVTFSAFNLENNWDFVRIDTTGDGSYDASYTGSSAPGPVSGASSIQFTSDGSVTRPGFEATLTCP